MTKGEIDFEYYAIDNKRSIIGELCILSFITIWITSLLSPIILLTLILNKYYILSSLVTLICIIAYLPSSFDKYLQSPSFRKLLFHAASKYYHKMSFGWIKGSKPYSQHEIDNNINNAIPTLFCVHPHGIFSQSWGWIFTSSHTIETVFMFSNALYISPFFRLWTRCCAKPSGCDKKTMQNNMKSRQNCAIIPGGFHDASLHSNINDRIFLKNRKGFIKYAIQYGYSLTPVFGFGEKDTFYNVPGGYNFRFWLNDLGIPGILPFGRWICPILPRNERLHVIVDEPLLPPKLKENEKVTKEMVDEHHRKYMEKVRALHEKYAPVYYQRESQLEIW